MMSRMRWGASIGIFRVTRFLDPKDRRGTTKEMLRSLVDAGLIDSSFWKLEDNPPQSRY